MSSIASVSFASVSPASLRPRPAKQSAAQSPGESRVIPFPVASVCEDEWQSLGQAASNVLRNLRPLSLGQTTETSPVRPDKQYA